MSNVTVASGEHTSDDIASNAMLRGVLRLYISTLSAIIVVICFLDLANYLNLIHRILLPKYIYISIVVVAAPIFLLQWKSVLRYMRTYPSIWFISLAFLDLIHWFVHVSYGNVAAADLTLTRVQFLLLAIIFGFILTRSTPKFLAGWFVATAILLSGLQLADFVFPGFVVPVDAIGVIPGRASSTLLNANKAAESLALLYVLGAPGVKKIYRLWLLLVVFAGVFVTFSRSGMLALLMILIYTYYYGLISRRTTLIVGGAAISLVVVAGGLLIDDLFRFIDFQAMGNIYNRLMFFSNLDVGDESAGERLAVAEHAFTSFLQQPFFGNGSGFTSFWDFSSQGPHNQQLLILAEYGMVGYLMLLWLIVLMFRGGDFFRCLPGRKFHFISVLVFLMFTLFTHNMFDFLYWLLAIVLISYRGFGVNRR